jgi:hypothetical protein
VFEPEKFESSPELSDSFKEELENARKEREAKMQQEATPSDEEIFVDTSDYLFSDKCAAVEKTLCDIDESKGIKNLKIRDSLMLAYGSPSFNVTKTRPHYIIKDATPSKLGSLQPLAVSSFEYNSFEFPPLSPRAEKASKAPLLVVEQAERHDKTPVKNCTKKDKFSHVKSPVAEYIHNSVRSPLTTNVKVASDLIAPSQSPRHNFRDSNFGGDQQCLSEAEGKIQSLPNRMLLKRSNVIYV